MLIDWFTVGAQVLNFIILIWLMKKFLYGPILQAIAAREAKVEAKTTEAANLLVQANEKEAEFKRKNEEFEANRQKLLAETREKIKIERERLMSEVTKAADALQKKRQTSLKTSERDLVAGIKERCQKEVLEMSRKVLIDLAEVTLEDQIIQVFLNQLENLKSDEQETIKLAFQATEAPIEVSTAFELSSDQRICIINGINSFTSKEVQIHFKLIPKLISGIELKVNGQKVAWSITDYLSSLKLTMDELVHNKELVT